MGNATGVIYGRVKSSDGSPIAGVDIDLNWIQRAEGGALKVGGDDNLKTYVPRCPTAKSGEYIIPFFWESAQVPGNIASALAIRWESGGSYTPINKHGQLGVGVDVRKLIGVVAPPIPSGGPSAAGMFLDFWIAADQELKGMSIIKRFLGSFDVMTAELQGCFSNIDFVF
jgi:hypothetical protein